MTEQQALAYQAHSLSYALVQYAMEHENRAMCTHLFLFSIWR